MDPSIEAEYRRLLGSPGAGLSALADAPQTVGLSALAADPLGEATAALETHRRQQVENGRAPPWMRDIAYGIDNLFQQPLSAFIPPELRDRLPSPETVASLVLGAAPGSGDYMAARDAIGATGQGISALGQGDYMRAGARGVDAFAALLGTAPFLPYFAGMASKPSTYDIGSRIQKHAADMGWEVTDTARSASSGSNYLHLARPSGRVDKYGDPIMDHVKLRISDHDLPPSYKRTIGEADYDVGVGGKTRMDDRGDWADAVNWLARRAGVEPRGAAKAIIAKREAEYTAAAAEEARRVASQPSADAILSAQRAVRDQAVQALRGRPDLVDRLRQIRGMEGKQFKDHRRAISKSVADELGINAETPRLMEYLRALEDGF